MLYPCQFFYFNGASENGFLIWNLHQTGRQTALKTPKSSHEPASKPDIQQCTFLTSEVCYNV